MPKSKVRWSSAALALALLAGAACSSDDDGTDDATATTTDAASGSDGTTTSASPPVTSAPPEGLPAFYGVPDPIPDVEAGTLLADEIVDAPGLPGTLHRVLYVSRSLAGEPIGVTGLVAVPEGEAPDGGWPVLAWAHGTTGIADVCAPSLEGAESIPLLQQFLEAGYVVTSTDYEGLGTPGRHPYIVGESEARGVFDSVRAAAGLDGVELDGRYAVWGHSQGGHAAMFALDGADYLDEYDLVGVVAGAPPSQFGLLFTALQQSPFAYYLLMASAGINAAYGDDAAPLDAVLTPAGLDAVGLVDDNCGGELFQVTETLDVPALIGADPATLPDWSALLEANDPGQFTGAADAPLLVIHGGEDEQIPLAASALMFDQLCAIGQDQTRWVYPGQSHAGVIGPSAGDMLGWIERRFAGEPTPDATAPVGLPGVEVQSCP